LVAMGIAAFLCVFIGIFPGPLYSILPAPVDYNAYTTGHVLKELQLLLFTGLGFFLLLRHVGGENKIAVDTDWIYRDGGRRLVANLRDRIIAVNTAARASALTRLEAGMKHIKRHHGRDGKLARTWPTGSMAFWVMVLLASLLMFGINQN
ncbi:MAG: Na+/H+ antiporter subunit D, partial [Wenzhouxiangella sp.]